MQVNFTSMEAPTEKLELSHRVGTLCDMEVVLVIRIQSLVVICLELTFLNRQADMDQCKKGCNSKF